jgi:divalent metal cation (Fe/Co/Zn/Cd) transporter
LRVRSLLVGLGANALLGWWWADPLTGLVIAGVALREGLKAGEAKWVLLRAAINRAAPTNPGCACCEE